MAKKCTWKRGRWTVHTFCWGRVGVDIIPRKKKGGYLLATDIGKVAVSYIVGGTV